MALHAAELRKTLKLSIPIIISNLSNVGLGIVDSAMIGAVDYKQLAASSLVLNVVSLPMVLGMGFGTALSPLTAIANGQKDTHKISRLLYNGVILSTIVAVVIVGILLLSSHLLYHLGQDQEVADYAVPFFKIFSLSLIPLLIFIAVKQFCDGIEYTKTAMVLSIAAMPVNAFFNWIFIYGNLGFPRMELFGAGLGTFVTRVLMAAVLIIVVFRHRIFKPVIQLKSTAWKIDLHIWKEIAGMGVPTSLQYGMEVAAFAVSGVMIGWLGATSQAAHQIALQIATFTFMAASGLAMGGSIRVANAFGRNEIKTARHIGISTLWGGLVFGGMCALLFVVFRHVLPLIFTNNEAVLTMAAFLMLYAALFQVSDATQAIGVGLLRGVKDVKMPTALVTIAYWAIGIPVGYYLAFIQHMGASGIWLGFVTGLTASSVFLNYRFIKRV